MATKWNDLKHKASPEKREQLKQEAVVEQMNILRAPSPRLTCSATFGSAPCSAMSLALGGRLEVHAVFPDDTVDLNSLVDASGAIQRIG